MNPSCPICNTASPFLMEKDEYSLYRCPSCSLIFVHPQPPANYLKEEVYSEKSGYQANKAKNLDLAVPNHKQIKLLKYVKKQTRGTFLDVGCSSGDLMYFVEKVGFIPSGVELNPRTAKIARDNGLDVRGGTLEEAHFADASFDYVHMGDLIEHVPDPKAILLEAHRVMKKGGKLIIVTPNMDCFWARITSVLWKIFRIPWSAVTPPHHLFQFSESNLNKLLTDNGFRHEISWYGSAPSLRYELGSLHLLKRWKNHRTIGNLLFTVFSFGLYSIVYAVNKLIELFPVKRFSMALVAQKI